jgi:hypothetical protein
MEVKMDSVFWFYFDNRQRLYSEYCEYCASAGRKPGSVRPVSKKNFYYVLSLFQNLKCFELNKLNGTEDADPAVGVHKTDAPDPVMDDNYLREARRVRAVLRKDTALPEGKTCNDCLYRQQCLEMRNTWKSRKSCDYYPVRFKQRLDGHDDACRAQGGGPICDCGAGAQRVS